MITLALVVTIGLISYNCFNNRANFDRLKHSPYMEARDKSYYRWLTAGFVHGDWMHLLINLFVLYMFGSSVEKWYAAFFGSSLGATLYLLLFIVSVVGANIATYFRHGNNPGFASVGASGGVSGILFAYVVFQPWAMIYLYGLIGIPGIIAAIAYIVYSYYRTNNKVDYVDHEAHMYGAIFGFLFTIMLNPGKILPHFIEALTSF